MIKHLIFDLDNTVYPENSQMSKGVGERILGYATKFYKLDPKEAWEIREEALKIYGTTLEWMKAGGFNDIEDYFGYVHPASEIEELNYDPELPPLLASIDMPKIILTNSPCEHAEHVLNFLGIRGHFHETICDIRMNGFKGKPARHSYEKALELVGGTIEDTVFLDDYSVYVEGYAALGGTAILVGSGEMPVRTDKLPGTIYRIRDIYELPQLLRNLNK